MDKVLFDNGNHKFILLGFAESKEESGIPSNQYLIIHKEKAILLDPGGFGLFPVLISRVLKYTDIENIEAIILSHQDPDVAGGLNIWLETTKAKVYISKLWTRFIPHYDISHPERVMPVNDEGMDIKFSEDFILKLVPAHFLHSPGQMNVYDPVSKILFTGDIGAGVLPCSNNQLFVKDFDDYVKCIEKFHKRYMASNKALRKWVKNIRELDVEIIAPQHGYLYKGDEKDKLLEYLENLKCGVDLYD